MQVPREWLDNYTGNLNFTIEAAQTSVQQQLRAIDYTQQPEQVREQVLQVMNAHCSGASQTAAHEAAIFYDGLRERVTGNRFGAKVYDGRSQEATERSVRAFLNEIYENDDYDEFERLCLERVDYEVKRAAGKCVEFNVGREGLESETRYARVPSGTETCDFCIMLASRGPIYLTEESAGAFDHWHANCDCRVVPFFGTTSNGLSRRTGNMSIEGYDPDKLYDQWQSQMNAKAKERADRNGTTPAEELQKIMDGYAGAAARARGRRAPERAASPESSPRFVADEQAMKQARILARTLSKPDNSHDAAIAIIKAKEQWERSTHSVDADNYFAGRVDRVMYKFGLSNLDVYRIQQWYYANH